MSSMQFYAPQLENCRQFSCAQTYETTKEKNARAQTINRVLKITLNLNQKILYQYIRFILWLSTARTITISTKNNHLYHDYGNSLLISSSIL